MTPIRKISTPATRLSAFGPEQVPLSPTPEIKLVSLLIRQRCPTCTRNRSAHQVPSTSPSQRFCTPTAQDRPRPRTGQHRSFLARKGKPRVTTKIRRHSDIPNANFRGSFTINTSCDTFATTIFVILPNMRCVDQSAPRESIMTRHSYLHQAQHHL